ncbi:MAG TPA: oxidoreductase [Rubrobacteraceae bacterium]|nr:oxidoreductase [Rubrobacteraceae bacterium]
METFKAYRVFNDGRIRGELTEISLNDLDRGEVLLRASFSSVNYKDALAATGAGKIMRRFPMTGGIDVSGEVAASTDPRFREGDRVLVTGYGMSEDHDGGYSQWVRVPADWVVPLPSGLSLWEAMGIGTAGLTAALSVHRMEANGLRPENGPVVVTGATGGVGSLAVDVLAGMGYEVTAVTGKDEEHDFLRRLGAKSVLSRHDLRMGERPLEKALWAGAVDPVGGELLSWLTRTTLQHGSIASCGLAGGTGLNTSVMPFILRSVNLLGINTGYFSMDLRRELWERLAGDMRPRYLEEISQTIDMEQLPDIFGQFLQGSSKGRIVVRIAPA